MPSASKLTVQIFIIIYSYKTCHKNYRNGNNHTLNKRDKLLNSFKEKSKNIEKALWKIIRKFMKNNKLLIKLRRISKRVVIIKEKIDNISNLVKRELFNNLLSQSFKNGSLIHNTGFYCNQAIICFKKSQTLNRNKMIAIILMIIYYFICINHYHTYLYS